MPHRAIITVIATLHRPVVQTMCVERSVIIVHMIPSAVQENAAGAMVNAKQDVRIASVNALGPGRPVVPMVSHAEKCAPIAHRITSAELEDAVTRMANARENVLMAFVEKVALARPTTTAGLTSAATQKVYARRTAKDLVSLSTSY